MSVRPRRRGLWLEHGAYGIQSAGDTSGKWLERDGALRLLWRDVPSQACSEAELARLFAAEGIAAAKRAVHRQRHPRVPRDVVEADKIGRHDPDDRQRPAIGLERAAEDRRIAIEEAGPCLVGQDRDRLAARRAGIIGHEASSEPDARTERGEVVARHEPDRHLTAVRGHGACRFGNDVFEQVLPRLQVLKIAPAEGRSAGLLSLPADCIQAVGIVHREWTEHVGVKDREDDCHEPHADGQRQHRGGDKCAALSEPARRVAQVPPALFEQDAPLSDR